MLPLYRDGDVLIVEPTATIAQRRPRRRQDHDRRGDGQGAVAPHADKRSSSPRSTPTTRPRTDPGRGRRMDRAHRLGEPVGAHARADRRRDCRGSWSRSSHRRRRCRAHRRRSAATLTGASLRRRAVRCRPCRPDFEPLEAEPASRRTIRRGRSRRRMVAPPPIDYGDAGARAAARSAEPARPGAAAAAGKPDDWDGTILYRPVAIASAEFEAMGYTDRHRRHRKRRCRTRPASSTAAHGHAACARAPAFRLWLRGRALVVRRAARGRPAVAASPACRLGKQDVGAWLVANGWARAAAGGPYAEAEEKARAAQGMGIFGAAAGGRRTRLVEGSASQAASSPASACAISARVSAMP